MPVDFLVLSGVSAAVHLAALIASSNNQRYIKSLPRTTKVAETNKQTYNWLRFITLGGAMLSLGVHYGITAASFLAPVAAVFGLLGYLTMAYALFSVIWNLGSKVMEETHDQRHQFNLKDWACIIACAAATYFSITYFGALSDILLLLVDQLATNAISTPAVGLLAVTLLFDVAERSYIDYIVGGYLDIVGWITGAAKEAEQQAEKTPLRPEATSWRHRASSKEIATPSPEALGV